MRSRMMRVATSGITSQAISRTTLSESRRTTSRATASTRAGSTAGGWSPDSGAVSQPSGESGYGQEESAAEEAGEEAGAVETEEMPAEDMLTSTGVSEFPAFYTEFSANYMSEETKFLLYYIVAGDYIFIFLGRSPASEFEDLRPQFFSITRSFTWQDILDGDNPENPEETPGVSGTPAPVIICT